MAGEEGALKIYWDHFFKAETGTYEKSSWLDLFLAEFLIQVNNGANPKELINFCPVSGVVTLVGCELLCGIHRVTSTVGAHVPAPAPPPVPLSPGAPAPAETTDNSAGSGTDLKSDERQPTGLFSQSIAQSPAEILRKYLLGGVAWRCLALLKALGVEGLSCCRQLSSVLVWLFGELGAGSAPASPDPRPPPLPRRPRHPRDPMHQLFSSRIWSKQKPTSSPGSKTTSTVSSEKGSLPGRLKYTNQSRDPSEGKTKRKSIKKNDESSETGDSNDDLQVLNRSLAIKVSSPDDFEYFNSPLRSSIEFPNEVLYGDPFQTPKKIKPKADDYMNDKHREIISSEITAFDFTLMITDLLQELCKTESSFSGSEGSQISMQCINFSLKNLCSLQFGSLPTCSLQYTGHEVSDIKVALTELLIVSLDKVLIRSDLCTKLINNGILPMLLRILEDIICKSSSKYHKKSDEQNLVKEIHSVNFTESDNSLKFIFGIAYSIAAFFHCLLMQCRTLDNLREFTDQFKLYGDCLKGGLLKECIELMIRIPGVDTDEAVVFIRKLVECIGKLVSGMKRVRSEVVHSAACGRARHKACRARVLAGLHHHHDILGDAITDLPLASTCCISILYGTLASLLTVEELSAHAALRNKTLRVMLTCGVCCCFSPGVLMEHIVRLMLTHGSAASKCLQVLEHTVYGELGASVLIPKVTDQLPCSICEPSDDTRTLKKHCLHAVNPVERKSVWSFLIHYNSLLQLDNHTNVLHATVTHLLRVTPKCRLEMKYELLFSVIYPTFIVSKHRYIIRMEESAYFLTVSCLNIFSSLLNTVSFADQFIQKGGLSYVLELVSLPEFSKQCCSILEIAIIVEIFKLIKENSDMTYFREMSSLASVQMLFKSLSEMSEKCFKIYRLKLSDDIFEELCDITTEKGKLCITDTRRNPEQIPTRNISVPKHINTAFASSENVNEDTIENHIEILKNIWTFWKSCAGLCLYSPMFRQYMVSESAFLDSYALLKVILHYLCNCDCGASEMRVLIKILEALLTVQFAVSDVTSGRSKAASCGIVREALAAPGPGALAGGAALRALCEALVHVAATAPAAAHAMPPPQHGKMPPLLRPSCSSSVEGSSSEDSVAAPYASEHSEPYDRADEGYEADVEIGKFDLLRFKSKKMSESLSTLSSISGAESTPEVLESWRSGGALQHPELCVLVLDVLATLVHRLVSTLECDPEEHAASRAAAASLARACCARLAGAVSGARAPPPLLPRLLAPLPALLAGDAPHLAELQNSIIELIHVLASQSISPAELGQLLRAAGGGAAARARLLPALLRLASAAPPAPQPQLILTFPIQPYPPDNIPTNTMYSNTDTTPASQSHQAEAAARALREAHLRNGIQSPWSAAAVRGGVEGAGWAPWLQGFAAVIWMRAAQPTKEPESWADESNPAAGEARPPRAPAPPLHVLSIGHDSLLFEVWLQHPGAFIFRLSRPEPSCNKVLSETKVDGNLPADQWSCVAINVKEVVHKRKIHIQVTLYVNGCECETVSLPLQGILVRKVTPTNVLLGHCGRAAGAVYHVSTASVYRAAAMSKACALHVAARPAAPPHAHCQVDNETPNYSTLLTPAVLDSDIDWDQVYEISDTAIRELNDNLLLSFSAHTPTIMNLYHQTAPLPTVVSPVFSGRSGAGRAAGVPEPLAATWAGAWRASEQRLLPAALYTLHGPDLLLYLFAKVVEMEGSAEEQATALAVLLRVCRGDSRLYSALYNDGGLDMLLPVLASHKCRVSHHMLKVILDEACTSPVLSIGPGGAVVSAAEAAVREPALLALLARAARHLDTDQVLEWELESSTSRTSHRGSLWTLTLCCLQALVEGRRRAFNQQQLLRKDLLRLLLAACKERFLNSEAGPLEPPGSAALVRVVRGLLGAPPPLAHLALLADFLLLMHQASDTFVTHSRANFYFLLTSETQEMSEFNTTLLGKRDSIRRQKKSDGSAVSTIDPSSDNSVNVLKEMAQNRDKEERTDPDSSVESMKQMKGIINMQIKEGRVHNISSTSENSDIAIDVEDVSHTTVEMYSSGLYQQRRVRAGAAPGWTACEGLLLLLRDAIAMLSDSDLAQAVLGAIQAETLVVLANHRDAGVRAAVVRCLCALQRRADPRRAAPAAAHLLHKHLANQIALYPVSWELASACASLLTRCDVPLEDQLEDDIWRDVPAEALPSGCVALAALAGSLHDAPLAHNLTLFVRRLIDKGSLKQIAELSIPEVAVRCIRSLGQQPEFEGRELLLDDMHELLGRIAAKALQSHHHMQIISDMHHMLSYAELTAAEEGAREAARAAQTALYVAQLDHLDHACCPRKPPANYFATVLSSAVSLTSEGLSGAELEARHLAVVSQAVAFLQSREPALPLHAEPLLVERLLTTLITAVSEPTSQRKWWGVSGNDGWVRALRELWWWAAAPAPGVRPLQPRLLRALHAAPHAAALLAPPAPPPCRKLAVYLLLILKHIHSEAEHSPPGVELAITDWARSWAVALQAGLAERLHSAALPQEAAALLRHDEQRWAKARDSARLRAAIGKVVFSKDALASKLTETAMAMTRQVVDIQNGERKAFMEHLRRAHSLAVAAQQRWTRLVDTHTHEQALWHDPASYPQSWQLDSAEAPGRVRVRLRRAHLNVRPRFLQKQHQHKAELAVSGASSPALLRSVCGGGGGGGGAAGGGTLRGGLVARLQLHETVAHMARVAHVTVAHEARGELLLTDRCIHFVPDDSTDESGLALSWSLESVAHVATRRWCLQERAVELFLSTGHAHLLAFPAPPDRAAFLRALQPHLPAKTEPETLTEAMNQWRNGTITNWEYLMKLNGLAGRSYNDLMQYPVLPFVIADYTSRILDLNEPATFRDLSKPMAIQNKNREQHYINTYNDLKAARRDGCGALASRVPHHYASLYSNPGCVLHYLVRLPPFTQLLLNYQDNNFDMPDRTFHSLATTWRLITNDSPTDVKELIPELFYLPELFHNNEGLNLGVRQCGAAVDDVELPPWAADARLFTLIHRQALEAPLVSERLPHWLDLVFGYKQTGQPAIDAVNVFPHCTYYGFDPSALEDDVERTAAAAMVRTYGQAPRQLLRQPHPQRAPDLAEPMPMEPVWAGVEGARWGRYCGSPGAPAPRVVLRRALPPAGALHLLPQPARAAAIAPRHTALLYAPPPPGESSSGQAGPQLALLSWGHSDGVVRMKRRRDALLELVCRVPPLDQITAVASSCLSASCPVVVCHASGRVQALRFGRAARLRARSRLLCAHAAPVADAHVCERTGLLVTASVDGKIVLWDLNDLTYIRTLPNRDMLPVTRVTISETLCDVASVHDVTAPAHNDPLAAPPTPTTPTAPADDDSYEKDAENYKSLIRVHTVNARFVGSVKVAEVVECVVYSNAPEGVSVNCVAAGLRGGGVRLYSSWDLRPARYIPPATDCRLISIRYSADGELLFGCYADGTAVAWQSGGARALAGSLLPAHALF